MGEYPRDTHIGTYNTIYSFIYRSYDTVLVSQSHTIYRDTA